MTLRYSYEARYVFHKITDSVYKVHKDKNGVYSKGPCIDVDQVRLHLNSDEKVSIYDPSNVHIHSNFDLEGEETSA